MLVLNLFKILVHSLIFPVFQTLGEPKEREEILLTYTVKIIRRIGDHTSSVMTKVDEQTAEHLMRADIVRFQRFRIKPQKREYIVDEKKIILTGEEVLFNHQFTDIEA